MRFVIRPVKKLSLGFCYGCVTQTGNDCTNQSGGPACGEFECTTYKK